MSRCTTSSSNLRPIRRLTACRVLWGLVMAWRFAAWPTMTSPSSAKATTDGVVRSPSLFSITRTLSPSMIATQELVVPRSIPMIFAMCYCLKVPVFGVFLTFEMGLIWGFSSLAGRLFRGRDRGGPGHHHHGRTQQPVVQEIALLHHADHVVRRHLHGLHHADGLMPLGVELLPLRVQQRHAEFLENTVHEFQGQAQSFMHLLHRRACLLRQLHHPRQVQAVADGNYFGGETIQGVLVRGRDVRLGAPAGGLRLRLRAQK